MDCKYCSEVLKGDECIKCVSCNRTSHFQCVGLSEADFKRMLPMNRAKWKCPICKTSNKSSNSPQVFSTDAKSLLLLFDERFNNLNTTIESFKTFITEEFRKVTETVKQWSEKITNMESSINSIIQRMNDFDLEISKIAHLESELKELQMSFNEIKENNSKSEQWVRRSNIQINGVPQKKGENLIQLIKILAEKANFPLSPDTDIDFITRIATKNDSSDSRPKPIILKLQARYKKDDFLTSLRKLKNLKACDMGFLGMQNRIYFNDHLSTKNKALFNEAKRLAKQKGYSYCWVQTWLLPGIFNEELFDTRYDVYRTDRDYQRFNLSMGDGTLIAVRREINIDLRNIPQIPDINDANITILNINLRTGAVQKSLIVVCCYFPQNCNQSDSQLKLFEYVSDLRLDFPLYNIIVMGDFNIKDATWSLQNSDSGFKLENISENILTYQLSTFMSFTDLQQYNCVLNNNNRLLDLVLSDLKCLVSRTLPLSEPEDGHHPPLLVEVDIHSIERNLSLNHRIVRKYQNADYSIINTELSKINWKLELNDKYITEAVDAFYSIINDLIEKYVPSKLTVE
ncbi:unnamed protein product, partial [Brenthis ino]